MVLPHTRGSRTLLRLLTATLFLCAAVPSVAQTASEPLRISLDEAIVLARTRNASLQVARAGADSAEAEALKTSRVFLPTLQLTEAYAATDHPFLGSVLRGTITAPTGTSTPGDTGGTDDSGGTGDPAAGDTSDPTAGSQTESTFFSVALLTQPIINVEGWLMRRQASFAADAANLQVDRAEAELELEVVRQYYALDVADERLLAVQAALEAANQSVETAEGLHEEGLAPPVDVHRARAGAARARSAVVRARADAATTQARLRMLLGVDEAVRIVPLDRLPDPRPAAQERDAVSLAGRRDLAAQRAKVASAEAGLQSSRWAYLPRLTGLAAYERQGDVPLAGDVEGWFIGAMLSWTPFAGLSKVGEVGVRSARLAQEERRLSELERQARTEVEIAQVELEAAEAELQEALAEQTESREAQGLARQRYAEGLAPITELLAADAEALEAALRVASGRYAVVLAEASLQLAQGRLGRQR